MPFEQLGLVPELTRALADAGYLEPTPIQRDAIPPALQNRDLVGCAQTGTGKTAAFCLPLLQRLDAMAGDDPCIHALVITPTRELAAQIGESLATYGRHLDLWHTVIFGGVSEGKQIAELRRGVDILVATPGRLLDLMGQGYIKLGRVGVFVLDEADQMLDLGFLPAIRRIIAALPKEKQTLFFSATMPPAIRELADSLLRDPVSVSVARVSAPAEGVEQKLYFVDSKSKKRLLIDLLQDAAIRRTLVFSRTKRGANRVAEVLQKQGIDAAAIHGNKSQGARTRALNGFRKGDVRVLVATDIAARGIDVDSVSHVINFDLPNVPETYVHRIGRTARAGAKGIALSFCDEEERAYLVDIERLLVKHIPRELDHGHPSSTAPPAPTDLSSRAARSGSGSTAKRGAARPGRRGQTSRTTGSRSGRGLRGGGGGGRPSSRGSG